MYDPRSCKDVEPTVTIPLSQYTDMVQRIQQLEDQQELDKLKAEMAKLDSKYNTALCKAYDLEAKLKEVAKNESV